MRAPTIPVGEYGPGHTTEIGGSRFALWGEDVINPVGWGQQWETKPYTFPTGVPMYGIGGSGYPNASPQMANDSSSMSAIANPLSFGASPLPWAIVAIVIGVVGLHWLHWREAKD